MEYQYLLVLLARVKNVWVQNCIGNFFVHTTLFNLLGMNFSDHMSLRVRGVDLFHKKMEEQSATGVRQA